MKGACRIGMSWASPFLSLFACTAVFPPVVFFAPEPLILGGGLSGPRFLQRPEIAELVMHALLCGESRFHRYRLHAFVVMLNHVHLLVTPAVDSRRWLGPLKGFTSYRANEVMDTHGTPFWQDESYDRVVRSDVDFERIRRYIEQNPVAAGLVASAEEFRWSSARAA